jgi:hypothetical protein
MCSTCEGGTGHLLSALVTQRVMSQRMILLMEDHPDDEALTRAPPQQPAA